MGVLTKALIDSEEDAFFVQRSYCIEAAIRFAWKVC